MTLSYRFRAARADGTIEAGAIEVSDRASAVAHLNARGLMPIEVIASTGAAVRDARVSSADLAVGLRALATMLESGLPIGRALAAFGEVAPPSWLRGLERVRERVRQGDGLSAALERSGLQLPAVAIGVIRAGESGSGLGAAVARAADIAESSAQLRSSIRNALAYPAVLAVTGTLSMIVIVGVVMPRFTAIIADAGATTPPLARATLAFASVAGSAAVPFSIVAAIIAVAWMKWTAHPAGRLRWHSWLLDLAVVGDLRLCAASSRACAALGALLSSGVPIAAALQHAARTTGDSCMERRVLAARDRVVGGSLLSTALAEELAVTPTARRMIRAGEESGKLATMLARAADLDSARLTTRLKTLVRLIEPLLIVAFAGIVALVAAALLQAVYAVRPG